MKEAHSKEHLFINLKIGFGILLGIFILFGMLSLYEIRRVTELSQAIYNHPLVVSNAALQANVSIAKMHRSMKDVVLFKSLSRVEKSIETVNQLEKQVYQQLDIIEKNILGELGASLESEARQLFDKWRVIREEVIDTVHNNQREQAAIITIGKGADHVTLLEDKMVKLTSYARLRAFEFTKDTEEVYSKMILTTVFFLLLGGLTSFIVASYTHKKASSIAEKLNRNEKRYRSLIETQVDLICRFTPNGEFVYVSDTYCRFFNMSRNELVDSKWQTLQVDDDLEHINKELSKMSVTKPIVIIENRLRSYKGDLHWLQFVHSGIYDPQGKLLEIQSVGRDITERKIAEEKLRATEENLKRTFDISPSIICKANIKTGKFTQVSPAISKILGFSIEEITSRPLSEFIHPDDRQRTEDEGSIQLGGKEVKDFENRYLCSDGSYKWLAWNSTPADDDGVVIAIGSDITERKRVEYELYHHKAQLERTIEERSAELKRTQEMLLKKEKLAAIGQLSGSVAHDIRNPLGVISNSIYFLNLTKANSTDKELKKHIKIIERAIYRANDIITDLMDFSREIKPDLVKHSIIPVIQNVLDSFDVPEKITVATEFQSTLPTFFFDSLMLHRLFHNLVSNAIQAMSETGLLTVTCKQVEAMVELKVTDTGMGIAPDKINEIFEPLFTTKAKGVGLGLSIVKTFAEKHFGTVEVESKVGKGSVFTIRLPLDGKFHDLH